MRQHPFVQAAQRASWREFLGQACAMGMTAALALASNQVLAQAVPKGTTTAASTGIFGPVVSWPIIPVHAALLPDGRVMTYGTDALGNQGAKFHYDIWDPRAGTSSGSHMLLPNTTGTDVFCGAQTLVPATGQLLLTGGDFTINGQRNYGNPDVNVFDYRTNELTSNAQARMQVPRWYPFVLTLSTGETLVLGGWQNINRLVAAVPEVYTLDGKWRQLTGAVNEEATSGFAGLNALYPRAFQAPNGKVFVLSTSGTTYYLDPTGEGSISRTPLNLPESHQFMPSVMYAPGKILTHRVGDKTFSVDITGMTPTYTEVSPVGQDRVNGFLTVLADGKIFATGGSVQDNVVKSVAYTSKIWDPATDTWSTAATSPKMRLYHAISMLLPDGSVLTGGGGAPGPQTNLDAEIYYPPYLYKRDGSGKPATRPMLVFPPTAIHLGSKFPVAATSPISRVTLVRAGSVTHSVDFDQRFIDLPLSSVPGFVRFATAPADAKVAPPGFYMMFVFDWNGVPSVATMVRIS
jgi:Domain of unknown function (DUF1929)